MRPIDRVIVKVNDKVYSFLDPLLLDETERLYCSNDGIVNKLAVVIPYNKDFINDIVIKSNKTFKMIESSDTILSLNGTPVYTFIIESIHCDNVNLVLKMVCPY